ncbi:MAG TPA: serine/threonine-protein kinase [Rhodanobacteraceae bacterium]|nr:serine/threonine-protein kinase [Rhodanobacteraceae bacterium]
MDAAERAAWQEADRHLAALLDLDEAERQQAMATLELPVAVRAKLKLLLATTHRDYPLLDQGLLGSSHDERGEPAPRIDSRIDDWHLSALLGHGGMASVYRAERIGQDFSQQAAIKLLQHRLPGPAEQARFRRERQILARLRHPHIAALLDGGVATDGTPYLAMALVEGERIDHYCDQHQLGARQRVQLLLAICDATAHAHRQLVIHRDIKPGNILVDAEGHAMLLDFGIARILDDTDQEATMTRAFTPDYAAPEQRAGRNDLGTAVDVYGLGAVLHRLLTGQPPRHDAHGEPIAAALTARQSGQGQPISVLRGDLDAIVQRALASDPAQRYASVDALATDLQHWLHFRPVSARKRNPWRRALKLMRRNPMSTSLAVTSLLLALAGGLLVLRAHRQLEQRAQELQQVVDFQTRMLERIDASQLGRRLRRDITATLAKPALLEPEQLASWQAKTDFTGIAAGLIDQALLTPSLATARQDFARQPVVEAALLQTLASSYRHLFQFDAAHPVQAEATALFLDTLGSQDRRSLASLREQVALAEQRVAPDMQQQAERSLALHRQAFGDTDIDSARARLRLGSVLTALAPERAEHALQQALVQLGQHGAAAATDRAEAHAALAIVLAEQSRYAEAEPAFRTAVDEFTATRGAQDADTLELRNMLAWVHGRLGDGARAHAEYQALYPLYLDAFGEYDPRTLNLLNNIAAWPRRQQDWQAAAEPLRKAWQGMTRSLGRDYPTTVRVAINLAEVELGLGDPAKARHLLEAAFTQRDNGDLHSAMPGVQRLLGKVALAEGKPRQAADWLTRAWHAAGDESQTALQQKIAAELAATYRGLPGHAADAARWQARASVPSDSHDE